MMKIIFSDIDGTLLNNERQVSDFTISEVKRITPQIPFVLVSARMPKQMYYIQESLGIRNEPLVAYNGALVLGENDKCLHSEEISIDFIEKCIEINRKNFDNQLHISLYNHNEWYAPVYDIWAKREENNTQTTPEIRSNEEVLQQWKTEKKGAHKIMVMGEVSLIEEMFHFLTENFNNSLHIYRAKDTYIEIASVKVSKLTGIEILLREKYHFSLIEAMAFGDNYNDIDMLKNVGCGVAVENAHLPVKEVAKAITKHHKEDGVAHFIKNYFKN